MIDGFTANLWLTSIILPDKGDGIVILDLSLKTAPAKGKPGYVISLTFGSSKSLILLEIKLGSCPPTRTEPSVPSCIQAISLNWIGS